MQHWYDSIIRYFIHSQIYRNIKTIIIHCLARNVLADIDNHTQVTMTKQKKTIRTHRQEININYTKNNKVLENQ